MAASLEELKIDRSRGGRSRGVRILWLFLVLAILGGAGFGIWRWWEEARIPVVRTAVVRQTLAADSQPTVLNASGYVTARLQSTVSSKVTGRVVEVLVEEGMAVTEGQVLARLDDTTERSYLALAEAQLDAAQGALAELEVRHEEARLNLDRQRRLLEQRLIGQADLDTVQAEADSLRARIANQREQVVVAEREIDVRRTALEDTVIRAPFSGVAISKDAQPGEMISPVSAGGGFTRTGVCTIVDRWFSRSASSRPNVTTNPRRFCSSCCLACKTSQFQSSSGKWSRIHGKASTTRASTCRRRSVRTSSSAGLRARL